MFKQIRKNKINAANHYFTKAKEIANISGDKDINKALISLNLSINYFRMKK
jgi:hypothetical protein